MRYLIIGFLSIVYLTSCTADGATYEVGSDFIENDIQIRVIDTFTVKTGTFKLDSLITSGTGRILLGSIKDDDFGNTTAKSYLELVASAYSISNDAIYDSIGMILNYDTYYYGDTTKLQTYNLHRITETFEPEDSDDFYNSSFLDYDSQSLGEISFIPKPNKETDSLFIKMDDVLGEEIFDKIVDNDINNSDDFLQYFKGLAIVPDASLDSHMLGFGSYPSTSTEENSSMRLYYTIKDDDSEDNNYYVDFLISSSTQQFNQIETDYSTSVVGDFADVEEIRSSEDTNYATYIQSGTGLCTRIEIPSIKKLLEFSNEATTLSATLTFSPLNGSYSSENPLPESLLVYVVDHKNRFVKQLVDINETSAYAYLNDNQDEFSQNVSYSVDLSGYVEEILLTESDLNYALMVLYETYDQNVSNLIIEDNPATDNQVKLTVKYLNY
ncbi:DUF4270 domain-containing protein [Polaribacter vadi]|uniref:DUF4270 family protein n=1 Tax=Polaribacter TaxID=52959 RepID=UPI001C0931F1|nr:MULTISPECIES: DUF4270 family protein [Polaribacter]MBU3012629.1 DUF4270 domain-containing protein [Polaribacter vadi]MDO6742447.1 DUF4270 family protein [Polaribacter sp. 1_MG-2023]